MRFDGSATNRWDHFLEEAFHFIGTGVCQDFAHIMIAGARRTLGSRRAYCSAVSCGRAARRTSPAWRRGRDARLGQRMVRRAYGVGGI